MRIGNNDNQKKILTTSLIIITFAIILVALLRIQSLNLDNKIGQISREAEWLRVESNYNKSLLEHYEYELSINGSDVSFHDLAPVGDHASTLADQTRPAYSLILLFSHFDCASCLNRELRILQKFYESNTNTGNYNISVFAITKTSDPKHIYWRTRTISSFPLFETLNKEDSIFSRLSIPEGKPLVVFVDNYRKRIIYSNLAHFKNNVKSEQFIAAVKRYLSTQITQT